MNHASEHTTSASTASSRTSLARIALNLRSREAQRDLRDATEMHRTLMRMVPDELGDQPRQAAGLLYRVDVEESHTMVLVQATTDLDVTQLPPSYGQLEVKDLSPMFAALAKGLGVRYRITANPTKRAHVMKAGSKRTGQLIPLSGRDADAWWARQATLAGLELRTQFTTPLQPARSRRQETRRMRHSLVRFDGTATVSDPAALAEALRRGIGRGKSYGAGLLSLAPVRAG